MVVNVVTMSLRVQNSSALEERHIEILPSPSTPSSLGFQSQPPALGGPSLAREVWMRQPGSLRALSRSAGSLLPSFPTSIYLYHPTSPRIVKGIICDAIFISCYSLLSLYNVSLNDLLLSITRINIKNLYPYFHLCSSECLLSSPFIVWYLCGGFGDLLTYQQCTVKKKYRLE